MILGIEVGLTILGIYTLIKGKWSLGKGRFLIGREATVLGILSVLTFPLVFVISFMSSVFYAIISGSVTATMPKLMLSIIEAVIVILWVTFLFILNSRFSKIGQVISKSKGSRS